ncbi:HD domain-containing phosphohydrolase [uncultured Pseudoteredinibacter sp.]|uniref:HD domain-containing phosphohydrolase n=1 Tax=uncultured Pseudoteredinibacter sp. TaxID=1641701 RepID=UPI0026112837|nr:HD domain-containing phosphohydrolase [uncultured Pseudoteredinibacter sp.]
MPEYSFLSNEKSSFEPTQVQGDPWKVLVVDDEPDIHTITELALSDFEYQNRGIELLHANSAAEAKEILQQEDDIGLILLDVVMESRDAGLLLVIWIREELKNNQVRIVLRTGQPGDAPERQVVRDYDINGYKEKSELTANKLYTVTCSSLRSYQDIHSLMAHEAGMKKVIESTGDIFGKRSLGLFVEGVLEQIFSLSKLERSMNLVIEDNSIAIQRNHGEYEVVAATGCYRGISDIDVRAEFGTTVEKLLATDERIVNLPNNKLAIILRCPFSDATVLLLNNMTYSSDEKNQYSLLNLFISNVNIAYENLSLQAQTERTQKEIAYRLGEAIENRSNESGNHVKRVAMTSELLALGCGLSAAKSQIIKIASPLHDIGKIACPDAILHKEGKLDPDEWETMKQHALIGEEMLSGSDLEIIRTAANLAGGHHERWEGGGYPRNLSGEDIPLEARITAVADVFDALVSKRCYKDAWTIEDALELIKSEKGKQFDPKVVDSLLENLDDILEIYKNYK